MEHVSKINPVFQTTQKDEITENLSRKTQKHQSLVSAIFGELESAKADHNQHYC